jgi:hypothetical protein
MCRVFVVADPELPPNSGIAPVGTDDDACRDLFVGIVVVVGDAWRGSGFNP